MNVEYACTDVQQHNSADHGHVNQHNLTYCTDIHCQNLTYFTDVKYVKLLQCICLRISLHVHGMIVKYVNLCK